MAEVFLSYAREDAGRAKALAAALERAGRSVWWDRNIEGGTEYSLEIDTALKAADAVVVLWSNHSVGSAWVRDEAAAGRDSNRLVPVRLDDAEPPLGFRQFQTIDLSRWKGRDGTGLDTLKSAVAAKLSRSAKPQSEPATAPPAATPRRRWISGAVAAMLLIAALAFVWIKGQSNPSIPAIAIVRAPSGGDPARSAVMARSLSVDLGAMATGSVGSFELLDTAGGTSRDVDYVVEVADTRGGGAATVDLSLLSRAGRQILWTSHLAKPVADQGALRAAAATRLASVLSCLTEAASAAQPINQGTLKLYLRGCENFRDEIGGLVDPGQTTILQQVVDRAPHFAPAIAHLALIEANNEHQDVARALIARAKALDPKVSKIYLAEVALLPRSEWSRRQAIIAQGLGRNPESAELNENMGFELTLVGRRGEALDYVGKARELDPMSPTIRASLVQQLINSGQTAAGEKELIAAESIWPSSTTLADTRYAFDLRFGDPARALRAQRENDKFGTTLGSTVNVRNPGPERFLLARIDPTPQNIDAAVNAYLARFHKDPADSGSMILSLGAFGRVDQIFEVMTHPIAFKSMRNATDILFRPYMRPMLRDPRFMPLAVRLGLVDFWTKTGEWPDFCLDPDLPYDCKTEAARLQRAGKVR